MAEEIDEELHEGMRWYHVVLYTVRRVQGDSPENAKFNAIDGLSDDLRNEYENTSNELFHEIFVEGEDGELDTIPEGPKEGDPLGVFE